VADGLMRRHCGRCVYTQRARYRPCALQGGYHSDLPSSWHSLERTVASVAPSIRCSAACLPTDKRSRTAMLAACNPTATLAASMSAVLPLASVHLAHKEEMASHPIRHLAHSAGGTCWTALPCCTMTKSRFLLSAAGPHWATCSRCAIPQVKVGTDCRASASAAWNQEWQLACNCNSSSSRLQCHAALAAAPLLCCCCCCSAQLLLELLQPVRVQIRRLWLPHGAASGLCSPTACMWQSSLPAIVWWPTCHRLVGAGWQHIC
jgi:hypothetical protein